MSNKSLRIVAIVLVIIAMSLTIALKQTINIYTHTIDYNLKKANIQFDQVILTKPFGQEVLFFVGGANNFLGIVSLLKENNGWKFTGYHGNNLILTQFAHTEPMNLVLYCRILDNPDITKVEVIINGNKHESAEIIQANNGERIWFYQSKAGEGLQFKGYNAKGDQFDL